MKKVLFSISFLMYLMVPHLAWAQGTEVHSGKVVGISGNGMPGVQVSISVTCVGSPGPGNLSASGTAVTDADGQYTINLPLFIGSSCPSKLTTTDLTLTGFRFYSSTVAQSGGSYLGLKQPETRSVSAASYVNGNRLTSEMIVATFGSELAETTASATTLPLPTSLAGRRVVLKDINGVEKDAPLFYVSPSQINYLVPAGLAPGALLIKVMNGASLINAEVKSLGQVYPGIFTANTDGQGVPAGWIVRVKADGSQGYEPLAQFDAGQNKFVPLPIDLGPESDRLYLVLFGTGWRGVESLEKVSAKLGGVDAQVIYAGLQPDYAGLDQMNILIPRSLAGRGEIDVQVTVRGESFLLFPIPANVVKIHLR